VLGALAAGLASAGAPIHAGDASAIRFPTSGAPEARGHFLRGVEALHNFAYEDAVLEFQRAQRIDPAFAMAYWGEAMAFNQTLWLNQDAEAARRILERLGPTPEARAARAGSDKERALLAAVELLFGSGDKQARDAAYAEALGRLHARYPADLELACFYALALLGTAVRSPALYSEADEEAHQHALVGSPTQGRAAEILEKVLKQQPDHPGALHYIIHDYDDPEHAALALPAARRYARLAPESSHALHMPAHVFVQLGLWDEAASADEAAFAYSVAWAKRRGFGVGMRDYHSLSWLCYEALQQGRYRKARETLELIRPAVAETGAARLKALQSSMRAQYVVETRSWEMLRGQADFGTSAELFAIGLSAAETGLSQVAAAAHGELRRRAQDRKLDAAVMEKELAAILELRAGRRDRAVALAEEAVTLERSLPPPLGPPRPVKPALELQGELLLELGRAREASGAFEQALARWPNRSASLLGSARALAASGERAAAAGRYRLLLANWSQADAEVSALDEARRAVAGAP
jgi:tetratricopeptide (TPR) repeat protein